MRVVAGTVVRVVAGVVGDDALQPGAALGGGVPPLSLEWGADAPPLSLEYDDTPPPALEVHRPGGWHSQTPKPANPL